jgi:hypothetical protein
MPVHYTVESADLNRDTAEVLALWVNNLPGYDAQNARAKLQLGYVANPAGACQVLLLRADDAVPGALKSTEGTQGLHARSFQLGAQTLRVAALADLVVNAEHRSLGPALMLMRRSVDIAAKAYDLAYGLPNSRAAAVCTRAGLEPLGTLQRYAKPLASREKLSQRVPAWVALLMADRALIARDAFRGSKSGLRLTCRSCSWNDPALDDVWAHRPAGSLLSQRGAAMLRWRFDGTRLPQSSPRWEVCVAHDAGSAVQGYVVWRQNTDFIEVGDFFVKNVAEHLTPMMLGFARFARRHRAVSVSLEFFGNPEVMQGLLPPPEPHSPTPAFGTSLPLTTTPTDPHVRHRRFVFIPFRSIRAAR